MLFTHFSCCQGLASETPETYKHGLVKKSYGTKTVIILVIDFRFHIAKKLSKTTVDGEI